MHLDADDLLARIRQDWPVEYELAQLRLVADLQAARITELEAEVGRLVNPPAPYSATAPRPYVLGDETDGRHV